jgi:hypothetical protein
MLLGPVASHAAGLPSGADAAFATLKVLQGVWTIRKAGHDIATKMTYDIGSRGSIVTEEFGRELSVFSLDRGTVLMTHYCNADNQPRLRLTLPVAAGVFDFIMTDITGLDEPGGAHVREVVYRMRDARTMDLTIVWANTGAAAPEAYTLTRQ